MGRQRPPAPAEKPKAAVKEKKKAEVLPSYSVSAADFFTEHMEEAASRSGGTSYMGDEAERACIGLPLEAFSLQYIYSSDVYPLGRMEMVIGESDSCKTAFLFDKGRMFLNHRGGFNYQLNEARDPATLRSSIIGRELLRPGGGFTLDGPCPSLETWQRNVTGLVKKFERTFEKGGCPFPAMTGPDSITGTTNERAIKKIDEAGCAQLTFGQDANLINQYTKYIFPKLYPWPISFVCTSHIKFGSDDYGNKVMRIPGGDALRYVSTYITYLEWSKKALNRSDAAGGRNLRLKSIKSMGDHRSIDVQFVWTYDAANKGEQHSYWDWHKASVVMLTEAKLSTKMREAVDDICNIYDTSSGTHGKCAQLGIKKATPVQEIGRAIMGDTKVLAKLQGLFGIPRRAVFQSGVPYSKQLDDAVTAGSVAKPNFSDIEGVAKDDEDGLEMEEGFISLEDPK